MPLEYDDKLRLLFRLECRTFLSVYDMTNQRPIVMECYHLLGNALQAFLSVVQDLIDYPLNGTQTEYKHTVV